jgi:hypothetical protein
MVWESVALLMEPVHCQQADPVDEEVANRRQGIKTQFQARPRPNGEAIGAEGGPVPQSLLPQYWPRAECPRTQAIRRRTCFWAIRPRTRPGDLAVGEIVTGARFEGAGCTWCRV